MNELQKALNNLNDIDNVLYLHEVGIISDDKFEEIAHYIIKRSDRTDNKV